MNWEQRFCLNPFCIDAAWVVQRDPTTRDIWRVAAYIGDCPITLAARAPVCPRCGTTLLTEVELEGGLERHLGTEGGPIFDFVRSLS